MAIPTIGGSLYHHMAGCDALQSQGGSSHEYQTLLGIYVSQGEGANFWLSVLTDLQNRGVKDILIACIDKLNGSPEAKIRYSCKRRFRPV